MKYYVKICYRRVYLFKFIPTPFYHTFFEIFDGEKIIRKGFYNKEGKKNSFEVFVSLFKNVIGEISNEKGKMDKFIVLSEKKEDVKKVLKTIKESKAEMYNMLGYNCFDWRNGILKKAGLDIPKDSWFGI
jgi:hypothetical protein